MTERDPTFTCSMCGGTFEYGWADEDAIAEKDVLWGDVPADECDVICDDCFQAIMPQEGSGPICTLS